jgi:hypothetical protein
MVLESLEPTSTDVGCEHYFGRSILVGLEEGRCSGSCCSHSYPFLRYLLGGEPAVNARGAEGTQGVVRHPLPMCSFVSTITG